MKALSLVAVVLAFGSIISGIAGYADDFGFVWLTLLLVALLCVVGYVNHGGALPNGSASVCLAAFIFIYTAGLAPRAFPVFSLNPTYGTALLVIVGVMSIIGGYVALPLLWKPSQSPARKFPDLADSPRWLKCVFIVSVSVGLLNYATGEIPLLADDVNATRFGGSFGVLGRLWPVIYAVLQFQIVHVAYKAILRNAKRSDWLLLGVSCVMLVLGAGRSLLVFALLGCAFLYIEIRRPSPAKVFGLLGVGVIASGLFGIWRGERTADDSGRAWLQARGLDSWWGSLDVSTQTGPRVMEQLVGGNWIEAGRFFVGDLANFIGLDWERSDRLVTAMLHADPTQVGGLPPTMFGGLYLDWGVYGVLLGSIIAGALLRWSQASLAANETAGRAIWLGYFCSYFLMSAYSYFSLKPSWMVVALLSLLLHRSQCVRSKNLRMA